jgi:hypothetical protein
MMGDSGVTPGRHGALAQGDVMGRATIGDPRSTIGGGVTGACGGGGVTGLVVGPLLFGLFVGVLAGLLGCLLGCFTTLGCGVGWPMEPFAWRGVTSEAVMPAPEKVNDCAA